ncbi:helicase-related protein [Rhizobium sp. L1K21]|uniref:helicase-related protein n=1 Tax=Rhizobium sp. L1K21 TaxID=2954933 RepID=UPI002093FB28|nr:helicase-related protein [Rhizobium sp. L1K21]MCO6184597.1 phospholipase D-like domain-containing protein [Rhizobium sp. L1K21]
MFIVDNSDEDFKASRYLRDWCEFSKQFDIASGFFEIGALLELDGEWEKLDKIRVLMGDEVSKRTKRAFEKALANVSDRLNKSIEHTKTKNHFLDGVEAIVKALRTGKIECRVYRKDKFHAKTYITHARKEVIGSFALVGSSNFTLPGLTQNVELNVQVAGTPVAVLQEWYDEHWAEAEDITPEILQVAERHTRPYKPFETYARSLQQYFLGHEETAGEWEKRSSRIFPVLAKYQTDGYGGLLKRAEKYGGAFLCDGVGLGKTFIGLMLIERFAVHDKKNVALFVPKAAKEPVWERELRNRLPDVFKGYSRLKIFSHTDLMREKMQDELDRVAEEADVIIVDEAHHFRNTGIRGEEGEARKSRYWRLYDLAEGKQVFLLTATPINNRLTDFQHMVEFFSRHQADHFAGGTLGIHSLPGYIRQLEKQIENEIYGRTDDPELELTTADVSSRLQSDPLFDALVVQRSRNYVKESMKREGDGEVMFPQPRKPTVAEYSVRQTYGKLLDIVATAFHKKDPLFVLGIYNPYAYYKGDTEYVATALERGRLKQVVALIRTSFLKRFESSAEAFRQSCWRLLLKLLAWLEIHCESDHEKAQLERWKRKHAKLLGYQPQKDLLDPEADEDLVSPELMEAVEKLDRDDFKVDEIITDSLADLEQIADFLYELEKFKPSQDLKLKKLVQLLTKDPVLAKHKVLIFTEFGDTARYLADQLRKSGIDGVEQIDSGTKGDRAKIIQRFAPYYNESSSKEQGDKEIRVLISTDVLSEGLNLQDATRLINYDLHWNPVRLMQRIGRVDRRMNAVIEAKIVKDHPDQKDLRGTVAYWNFLPPDDLDDLLRLYGKVAHKTLRISKTLGIEHGKLLREDDDYEDLKNFEAQYEGQKSPDEQMHLEWQDLLKEYPDLGETLNGFPNGIFSGKENIKPGTRAVFFCYARPAYDKAVSDQSGEDIWTTEAGDVQWYLYDIVSKEIIEDAPRIIDAVRSTPETPRKVEMEQLQLSDVRAVVEKHIARTFLRKVQAPVGVGPVLKAWMELN